VNRKKVLLGGLATVGIALGVWVAAGYWISRDIEEPAYQVVRTEGDVEVRRYEPTIVAATVVEGTRQEALSTGFRRLAGYIFGKNKSRTEIAMTAPVNATPSEKIAMTAPVSATSLQEGRFRVTFTMPSSYTMETLPIPDDDRVVLEQVPGREVAALRFSGWASDGAIERHVEELLAWVEASDRTVTGAPTLAQYDPPFKMPLLRRNEILVELAPRS
jgi:hypothetical protein